MPQPSETFTRRDFLKFSAAAAGILFERTFPVGAIPQGVLQNPDTYPSQQENGPFALDVTELSTLDTKIGYTLRADSDQFKTILQKDENFVHLLGRYRAKAQQIAEFRQLPVDEIQIEMGFTFTPSTGATSSAGLIHYNTKTEDGSTTNRVFFVPALDSQIPFIDLGTYTPGTKISLATLSQSKLDPIPTPIPIIEYADGRILILGNYNSQDNLFTGYDPTDNSVTCQKIVTLTFSAESQGTNSQLDIVTPIANEITPINTPRTSTQTPNLTDEMSSVAQDYFRSEILGGIIKPAEERLVITKNEIYREEDLVQAQKEKTNIVDRSGCLTLASNLGLPALTIDYTEFRDNGVIHGLILNNEHAADPFGAVDTYLADFLRWTMTVTAQPKEFGIDMDLYSLPTGLMQPKLNQGKRYTVNEVLQGFQGTLPVQILEDGNPYRLPAYIYGVPMDELIAYYRLHGGPPPDQEYAEGKAILFDMANISNIAIKFFDNVNMTGEFWQKIPFVALNPQRTNHGDIWTYANVVGTTLQFNVVKSPGDLRIFDIYRHPDYFPTAFFPTLIFNAIPPENQFFPQPRFEDRTDAFQQTYARVTNDYDLLAKLIEARQRLSGVGYDMTVQSRLSTPLIGF